MILCRADQTKKAWSLFGKVGVARRGSLSDPVLLDGPIVQHLRSAANEELNVIEAYVDE
jgi:hypothetical protein